VTAPNRPCAGDRIVKAEWVAQAVRLAVQGYSIRRIAARVGHPKSTVAVALAEELEARKATDEEVQTARKLKSERLYRQLRVWRKKALKGDVDAGHLVMKIEDAIARLEGTDAPKKTELTGANGGPVLIQDYSALSDEQLERVARGEPIGPAGGESESGTGDPAPPSSPGDGGVGE
jgi:hypothetical protein